MKNKNLLFIGMAVVILVVAVSYLSNGKLFKGMIDGSYEIIDRNFSSPRSTLISDTAIDRPVALSDDSALILSDLGFEIWYSLASPASFNEGIVFTGEVPASFSAKSGYLYINDKQINTDINIYSVALADKQNRWSLFKDSPYIRYIVSPSSLRSVFDDGKTSSINLQLPIKKVTIKFCNKDQACSSKDYLNLSPVWLGVGDF